MKKRAAERRREDRYFLMFPAWGTALATWVSTFAGRCRLPQVQGGGQSVLLVAGYL